MRGLLDREAMYAVVTTRCRGYDTGTSLLVDGHRPHGCSDSLCRHAFWDAIDERGGLMRNKLSIIYGRGPRFAPVF